MATRSGFSSRTCAAIQRKASLRIKAGSGAHRFLGIWAVVVDDRVFVRSWNVKPAGWHRVWIDDPVGAVLVEERAIRVRAIPVRSKRLQDSVSRAYLEKYWRPASLVYARGLDEPRRRATTLELVPLRSRAARAGGTAEPAGGGRASTRH